MTSQHHIQTLKFEIDIPSKEKNTDVQNRIINVFNSQFLKMLDDVFDDYDADEDLVVDSLCLQLDPILIHELESKIVSQSKDELLKFIHKIKLEGLAENNNQLTKTNSKTKSVHPLLYYALHGVDSWQSQGINDFKKQWKIALKNEQFRTQCIGLNWNEYAIKRVVDQLSNSIFKDTIKALFPLYETAILQCLDQLMLWSKSKLTTDHQSRKFNKEVYYYSLHYLLTSNSASFSIKNFSSEMFAKTIRRHENFNGNTLKDIETIDDFIRVINIDDQGERFNTRSVVTKSINDIEHLMHQSTITSSELKLIKDWASVNRHFRDIQQKWVVPLKTAHLKRFISVLSPNDADFIFDYQEQLIEHVELRKLATSKENLQRAIWTFTLEFFIKSFSSVFQAREYVIYHAQKMANHYGLDPDEFIASLLLTVELIADHSLKNSQLLNVLKILATEKSLYKQIPNNSLKKRDKFYIDSIIEICKKSRKLTYLQSIELRNWLLDKKNLGYIDRTFIKAGNEELLSAFIAIILPNNNFILSSIELTAQVFNAHTQNTRQSAALKTKIYHYTFEYLLKYQHKFDAHAYLDFLFKSLIENLKIDFKKLQQYYTEYIAKHRFDKKNEIEFLNTFNALQAKVETAYLNPDVVLKHANNLKLEDLADFFISGQYNYIKDSLDTTVSMNSLQSIFLRKIAQNPISWKRYLEVQTKPYKFYKGFTTSIKTSLLRHIHVFNLQFQKWESLRNRYKQLALNNLNCALLFYFEEGIYPLWLQNNEIETTREVILSNDFKTILQYYNWEKQALDRWLKVVPKGIKLEFLIKANANNRSMADFFNSLSYLYNKIPVSKRPLTYHDFESQFWIIIFKLFRGNKNELIGSNVADKFLRFWNSESSIKLNNDFKLKEVSKIYTPNLRVQCKKNIDSRNTSELSQNSELILSNVTTRNNEFMQEQLVKWFITSAGLVLVHPFLGHLFKLLDYLDASSTKFKSDEMQSRAVKLLHFVATGELDFSSESVLAMPKVLCGMTIAQSLLPTEPISEEEQKTAIEMLEAMISQWSKLGNSSPDGLRNTFLKREGVLELKDQSLQLAVESSGTDILLDYIPWNISMVQLPWMHQIIYISWR